MGSPQRASQALVEVKVLTHIREHDPHNDKGTVRTLNHFYFRSHLCIVFELLSINLYEFIKNNNFKGVSLQLIKRFAVQLLNTLRFLRKMRILHCDLKPENILLCECVMLATHAASLCSLAALANPPSMLPRIHITCPKPASTPRPSLSP